MLDVVRQYVNTALGALPTNRAMELAAQATETIAGEIRKQLAALGLATKEEVDELKERLWRLESAGKAAAKAPAARKRTSPRPAARRVQPVDIGGS